jgi:hypothetical protein
MEFGEAMKKNAMELSIKQLSDIEKILKDIKTDLSSDNPTEQLTSQFAITILHRFFSTELEDAMLKTMKDFEDFLKCLH